MLIKINTRKPILSIFFARVTPGVFIGTQIRDLLRCAKMECQFETFKTLHLPAPSDVLASRHIQSAWRFFCDEGIDEETTGVKDKPGMSWWSTFSVHWWHSHHPFWQQWWWWLRHHFLLPARSLQDKKPVKIQKETTLLGQAQPTMSPNTEGSRKFFLTSCEPNLRGIGEGDGEVFACFYFLSDLT